MPPPLHPYRMAWSFRIARLFGIDVRIHVVLLALIAWVTVDQVVASGSMLYGMVVLSKLLLLIIFVFLHELGHSLMARRFGLKVHDITLWPLGGLARLEGDTGNPKTELNIAMAGPAVNLVLALAMVPFLNGTQSELGLLIDLFFKFNLYMGLINLVPAFPLDGGRILRAAAATKVPYLRATEIAVYTGKVVAVTCTLIAIVNGDFLGVPFFAIALISLFVLWAGSAELRGVQFRELGRYGRGRQPPPQGDIIDVEVVSSRETKGDGEGSPAAKGGPSGIKQFEKDFLDMIRRLRGKKGGD